jgi:hypothetical protein
MAGVPKNKVRTEEGDLKDDESSSTRDDQQGHRYYYDDAHGYEVYDPDDDNELDDDPKADPAK